MAGQTDSEFSSVAITETSRNVQYSFRSSPIPFECPDTILSTPLSSTMPHTVRMESNSRVFTPIPFQSRVSTPYPLMDSVSTGKDWSGPSPESRMFSPSWGFESTIHIGQPFQGSLLPMATGNSHTVHHYTFPQTWHHAVAQQNFSGYNPHCSDVWYGDTPLLEGLGNIDVGSEVIEQDSKVTSSSEVSPWKPQLALPPVSEFLNTSYGSLKWQNGRNSPVEAVSGDETCQLSFQHNTLPIKPDKNMKRPEVKDNLPSTIEVQTTQTPWKLKKHKFAPDQVKTQKKRKGKPKKLADPLTYMQQKTVQKERERKIRNELQHLSRMLPCSNLNNNRLSKKEILESAISHIMQLQENVREAYLQKGLKTEDLRASLQDGGRLSLSQACFGITDQQNDAAKKNSEDSCSPCSSPELTIDENLPASSLSPISELSSQESVEREESSTKTLQNGHVETPVTVNHIKRPMNAFLLYSQQYRRAFKVLYPGRDNREISTILAKHWREMKPEQKEPYKEKARELMRKTKESHPDFKYCEGRKETGLVTTSGDGNKQAGLNEGYRSAIYTITSGKGLEPPLKIKCEPGFQANIKDGASEMTDQSEFKAATAIEPELSRKMVKPGTPENQHTSSPCKDQTRESSQSALSVKVNAEWCPSTADTWVQCEDCKKWHMLPEESDPAILPDKWFCSQHDK